VDKTFNRIFFSVFGLVGLGLLTGAFFALRSEMSFRSGALTAEGTVVDLVTTTGSRGGTLYKPVVEYVDRNDRKHRLTAGVASSPPSYRLGESVTVRYRPEDPRNAELDSFMNSWFLTVILGAIGTVFTSIAAGFVIYALRKRRIRAWLAANGMRLRLPAEGVYLDTSMKINGRSPYRISAQWQNPMNQKVYVFHSDAIWFDPAPYMQQRIMDIRVNADNPHQYMMDISFLPKAG
jgi:hypothetical protein